MHGYGVRAMMSGGSAGHNYNGDYVNPRIMDIYHKMPQELGFKKCDYSDYPNRSSETEKQTKALRLPTDCWVIDVAEAMKSIDET